MNTPDVIVCDAKPLRFLQRFYLIEVLKGLGVTLRHFLGNLFARKYTVTVEWPEVKREYSERLRGRHILLSREDGSPRCVACYMCETACPAECIYIEAEEDPASSVEWEKRPRVFTIDLLRCVYCGFCVDACPKEAIIMSRTHEMAFVTRGEAIVGLPRAPAEGAGLKPRPRLQAVLRPPAKPHLAADPGQGCRRRTRGRKPGRAVARDSAS